MDHPRLLAIFAHPDDESFGPGGTLAGYARRGAAVHLCTVTDGGAGERNSGEPQQASKPRLAHVRRQELLCACQVLGVQLHALDYGDSGMEGAPENRHPGSLYQADLDCVARDLVRVMRDVRPQVVITHDPSGGYFHPDHVKVNHAVRRAWQRVGDAQAYPELLAKGHTPWRPARLYYTVMPRSTLKWFVRMIRLSRQDPRRFGHNKDIDITKVGVLDEQIHVRLDVGPYLSFKEQASACHTSQGGGGALRALPAFARRRFFRYEHFVQARPVTAGPHRHLFEGLDPSIDW